MWYRVFPWLFIFHFSLMDSLGRYFGEHRRGDVVHIEKDPCGLNGYYQLAKVEDLSSFQFCVVKCFYWVWWSWIETTTVYNECREKRFLQEEKPALEQLHSKVMPSSFLETYLNKALRDLSSPYSWPCMQQEDGLWVLPTMNYHVILWVCESLL